MPRKQLSVHQRHNIVYNAPVHSWDEGLPCGNGQLGLLVWGDGAPLNLSVDHISLWDNRPDPAIKKSDFTWKNLVKAVKNGDMQTVHDKFEGVNDIPPFPTKLPCGRITLDLGGKAEGAFESTLDLATATTLTRLGKGSQAATVTAYVHAQKPVIVVSAKNARPKVDFYSPFDASRSGLAREDATVCPSDVSSLQYPPLEKGSEAGVRFVLQRCAEGMAYCVAWTEIRIGDEWLLYLTVQQSTDGDALADAIDILREAKSEGAVKLGKTHTTWWRNYWKTGHVCLPDERFEKLWYAEMYKLGALAREGSPPISLQGVWTADEMALPPWRGDFHHDLNTEMSYWPVHTANRIEQGRAFADWLNDSAPQYRQFTRNFYNAPGLNVPGTQSLAGDIIRGWAPYIYSRTTGAWLAQHMWWHYRYTMDRDFLREVAYPFIGDVARFCASQLERDRKGVYHLHYSSSPEYNHNFSSSFTTDSTYDLSLLRYVFTVAIAAAEVLKVDREDAEQWRHVLDNLQPYHISPEHDNQPSTERGLAIWEGQGLAESHRHLAHLMPIFPLGDLNIEGSEADRELIRNSLYELEVEGYGYWCGYSFTWLACIGARIREPQRAVFALNQYIDAFMSPNSFHLNGDFRNTGASRFHYRPFTLEGNFAGAHAINEMLLQSWGDRVRIFPAVPAHWQEVSFTDLRAEGAFVISAWREGGAFKRAEILSEKGGVLILEHPHPAASIRIQKAGGDGAKVFRPGKSVRYQTVAGGRYEVATAD